MKSAPTCLNDLLQVVTTGRLTVARSSEELTMFQKAARIGPENTTKKLFKYSKI